MAESRFEHTLRLLSQLMGGATGLLGFQTALNAFLDDLAARTDPTLPVLQNIQLGRLSDIVGGGGFDPNAALSASQGPISQQDVTFGAPKGEFSPFHLSFQQPQSIAPSQTAALDALFGVLSDAGSALQDPQGIFPFYTFVGQDQPTQGGLASSVTPGQRQPPLLPGTPTSDPSRSRPVGQRDVAPQQGFLPSQSPNTPQTVLQGLLAQGKARPTSTPFTPNPVLASGPLASQTVQRANAEPLGEPAPISIERPTGEPKPPLPPAEPPPTQPEFANPLQQVLSQLSGLSQQGGSITPEIQTLLLNQIRDRQSLANQDILRQQREGFGSAGLGDSGLAQFAALQTELAGQRNIGEAQRQIGIDAATRNFQDQLAANQALGGTALGAGQFGLQAAQFQEQQRLMAFDLLSRLLAQRRADPNAIFSPFSINVGAGGGPAPAAA